MASRSLIRQNICSLRSHILGSAVSFTYLLIRFAHANLELIAFDLPTISFSLWSKKLGQVIIVANDLPSICSSLLLEHLGFAGHLAVSFAKIFAPFGRIFWEFVANDLPSICSSLLLEHLGFAGHLAVSFAKIFAPFGRIFWEFVANDLPSIFLSLSVGKIGLGHLISLQRILLFCFLLLKL